MRALVFGAPSRLQIIPCLPRGNEGCDPSRAEGLRMKRTSFARWHWLVGSTLFWISGRVACLGEGAVAGFSKATLSQSVPAIRVAWGQMTLALLQGVVLISLVTFTGIIVISVMTMMASQAILARGGIGKSAAATAAMKALLAFAHAMTASATISAVLSVFEFFTVVFYHSLHEWLFYAVPMLFALLLVMATCLSIVTKQDDLRLEIAVSKGRYRLLFERSLVGAYKATLDGLILDCNFSFCQIFGYASREEAIRNGATVGYFTAADRERFTTWLRAEKQLTNFEQCLRRKDGGTAWVLNSATLAKGDQGNGPVIKGTMMDISELRMGLPAWLRKTARFLVAVRWSFTEASQH